MDQLTFPNVLLILLGLLINSAAYLDKLKKSGKKFHFDISIFIQSLIGIVSAFVALIFASDMFEAAGAIIPKDSAIYTYHAFICGLMPNIIIDKLIKASSFFKK